MPEIWHLYHVQNCRHARPVPKDKYVAIVCRDLEPMGFLINSVIHRYIKNRPELYICQAFIEKANHKCLSRNSYVDCIDLYKFKDVELTEDYGSISKRAVARIKRAVSNSKTIEKRYKKLILGKPKSSPKSS